jgi:hypothetical protein
MGLSLAFESSVEDLHYALRAQESPPTIDKCRLVWTSLLVLITRNGMEYFLWLQVYGNINASFTEQIKEELHKFRHRHRPQFEVT